MDNIAISNANGRVYVTVVLEHNITSNIAVLREAAKILQREVLRYESGNNRNFSW